MADNSSKYSTRPFGNKSIGDLKSPNKEQTAIVYDLLAEGPIGGLVNDLSSVYYNDVPLIDSVNNDILKPRKFTANTTANSTSVTASEFGTIRTLSYNNKTGLFIGGRVLSIAGAGTKGTGIASITAGSSKVTTSSNYFTQTLIDNQAKGLPVYVRITGAGPGGQDLVCGIKKRIGDTSAELTTRAFTTVSGVDIVQDHITVINSISGNTATLSSAPTTAVTGAICVVSGPKLDNSAQLTNFSHVSFGLRTGELLQSPLAVPGFSGSSSTVYDANIQIRQSDLASVPGLSALGTNYNGTGGGSLNGIDDPGNDGQGSASDTVLTAAAMGVSNPQEVDEVHLTFSFPEMHAFKSSGAKGSSFVEFQMFFEFTSDGLNYTSALAFGPSNASILSRSDYNWGNNVTYGVRNTNRIINNGYIKPSKAQYSEYIEEFVMNVEQFQPFTNYRVRIRRITDEDFKDGSFQHKNKSYLKTVENITKDRLSYPYAAYAANVFNAKDFSGGLPSRAYKLRGKLIQVPTNYLTRDESSDGTAKYTRLVGGSAPNYTVSEEASYQTWNGAFRGDRDTWAEGHPNRDLVYCNNPAWVFYDILTNNRYGVGQFVDKSLIDKYSLFEIAKYCDELVSDGEGGLEPRFTTNLYLDKTAEATKVLRDIASVFRGMVLWSDGEIVAIADRPKEIVYTFTKGNVENGVFTYEGTGDRVRTNQVKVTWNDPKDNYRQAIEYVEDHQNILNTNRLVRESSVAFGCTSRAQAHRYGKWKLLSAQLEKETVSFTTGLNAIGLRPGDIIGVQDADKDGYSYSGRVSNTGTKSTTVIPLDRTIALPSYAAAFPPQLLLIYPEGGCYLEQEVAVINTVTYYKGDLLLENQNGTALDTQEEAANLKDDNGDRVLNFWSENVRVEKQNISTSAGNVSSLTVSSAFSSIPDAEVIWALQLFNTDGTPKTGTTKEFKVISVKEEKDQKVQIVAAEFAKGKFGAVDRGYTLYSAPIDANPDRDDIIPAPTNIVAKVEPMNSESPDLGETVDIVTSGGAKVTVSWNAPLTSDGLKYKNIAGFEIKHNFSGGFETEITNGEDQTFVYDNVSIGEYEVHIRTITTINTYSRWIVRLVEVGKNEIPSFSGFNKSQLPVGGQFNQAISIDSSTGLLEIGSSTYNFIGVDGTEYIFSGTGTGNYQQSFAGMGASATAFLLFDGDATSDHLKAVKLISDSNVSPAVEYYAEVGASNNGLTQASGTITVTQFSNQIDGTSTTFTSDFASGDLVKLDNGTAAQATYARVQSIESDTLMFIDLVSQQAYSGDDIYKQSYKPNISKDSIIAEIITNGSTEYSINITYAITAGVAGAQGVDGSAGDDARAVNLTIADQTFEYDTNGANPSPSSATATATALNTSDTVYYEFFKNDVSVQNTTSNTYSYSAPSAYTSMPEKLEVQIREGSNSGTILARDQITISGLKAGTDAITTILSNEAHTLPTTSAGVVTYTGSGTDIEVWNGTTQVPYDGSSPYASPSFRVTASGSNITVGSASTVSTYTRRFADHNSMTQNNAAITYTIIVKNEAGVENTFTRKQTFAKSIQGADGDPGSPGSPGATGPRTATGYIYYQSASASSPTSGSAVSTSSVSYNFSTSLLSGGVIGTGSTNWNQVQPTYTGSNSNTYWYAYFSVVESSFGGSYTVSFSIPYQGQNFTGLVTFTGTNQISDGSNTTTAIVASDLGSSGTTTIDGGRISASSTITVGSDGQVLVDGTNNRIIVSD
jgi:predicted phage tail protein